MTTFERVLAYFAGEGIPHNVHPERQTVEASHHGSHGTYRVEIAWYQGSQRLGVFIRAHTLVPRAHRDRACVLANLVNWGLAVGNFELDPEDGELVYRATLVIADGTLGHAQLHRTLLSSVAAVDYYLPAFQSLAEAGLTPRQALALLEERRRG